LAILQALLSQIVEQATEAVLTQIKAAMEDPIRRTKEGGLQQILAQACSLQPIFLVIDAVDELDKLGTLLAHIQPLVDGMAHILITSREIPEMKKFPNALQIEAKPGSEDIRTYLAARFREHELFDGNVPSDLEMENLVNDIVSKSGNLQVPIKHYYRLERRALLTSVPGSFWPNSSQIGS
jgi:hypothetical protein